MINVTKTHLPPLNTYIKYLNKIWENNWVTNDGEFSKKLEIELKKFLKVENIMLLGNGTLALQLAYKALDLKGEVITTPFTFPATTNSLIWEGIKPVFVDIDPNTFNIDPKEVEKKISKKTSAILAVHVFGNPCDMEGLSNLSQKYNLKLIYDAAHAFGVEYRGKSILRWGDASTLSFHAAKTFHTIEGGAVVSQSKMIRDKIKLLSNHGIKSKEEVVLPGINARMNEFEAVMGLMQLADYRERVDKRKKIYSFYASHFKNNSRLKLQVLSKDLTYFTYPYFPICFENEKTTKKVQNVLLKNGIIPRRYFYPPIHEFPYINEKYNLKNSEKISHSVLCLPLYEDLPMEDVSMIVNLIDSVISTT
ncbi:MAG: DegT/DnrJ/EryC1/StrS family aminotransferase [Patescibacteria group bacterium]